MNTRDNLLKRNALRSDVRVKRAIQMFWDMVPKSADLQIEKHSYISLLVRICKLVVPEFDLKDSLKTAEVPACYSANGRLLSIAVFLCYPSIVLSRCVVAGRLGS
jgi:hypothetical protein